jgi:hypothetical protein
MIKAGGRPRDGARTLQKNLAAAAWLYYDLN